MGRGMADSTETAGGRGRIWPGLAAPLGLTLILAACLWLFAAKVGADRENAVTAALGRESRARVEAGEMAAAAKMIAGEFVTARAAARSARERSMRLEVKGVLDSVYRLMTVSLDGARKKAAARREVGSFPPGFDGVGSFLALVPRDDAADEARAALQANSPELSALLPSGYSLSIVEDNARELLSLGGGTPRDGAVTTAMSRDFLFNDGDKSRHWSLRVELTAPDPHPVPTAREVADHVGGRLADFRIDDASWSGWLLGRGGEIEAAIPLGEADPAAAPPPFIDIAGEWIELDGKRLVWLEKAGRSDGLEWEPAVAVAIGVPPPLPELADEFWGDKRWSLTIGALAALALFGWAWFVKSLVAVPAAAGRGPAEPSAPPPRRRLVRDEGSPRFIPEVQGVIVADITDDGVVRLRDAAAPKPRFPEKMPSGSLLRLQGRHRGRKDAAGSLALDQARSQVLRELARRVRPAAAKPIGQGKAAGPIASSMKSPTGWRKVADEGGT